MTLRIYDTQHNNTLLYAECRVLSNDILNVVMLSFVMLNVIMLNVVMLNVVAPPSSTYRDISQMQR
jgi:hypothetical protein